ncbi:unnamed protein product, partial [Adineta steineri]
KQANITLVTKAAAFNWDLCAAHAIMLSIDGQILDLSKLMIYYKENQSLDDLNLLQFQITYNNIKSTKFDPKDYACSPFIAYYNQNDLINILQALLVNKIVIEQKNSV